MSERLEEPFNSRFSNSNDDYPICFLDAIIILSRHKRVLIGIPVATGVAALLISLWMPPSFTSTARIILPQQQTSTVAAMLGQLGGMAGALGGAGALKNPNDLYVGMLQSRTVADNLVKRFKLKERYRSDNTDEAREKLAKKSSIASGKGGLISIEVEDRDPAFAAELANGFVEELISLTKGLNVTEASQRRAFFEKQLVDAKEQLANAELSLRKTQESSGLIQLNGQVQGIIATAAQMKASIAAKEVQLNSMRTFATMQNPDVRRTEEEIRSLRAQLDRIQKGSSTNDADLMVPTKKIPQVGLEYARHLRDVKYYETIFEILAKQYELAKIDEAKDSISVQLVDKAVPAEKMTKPKSALMVGIGVLVGLFTAIFVIFINVVYTESRKDKNNTIKWRELFDAWR